MSGNKKRICVLRIIGRNAAAYLSALTVVPGIFLGNYLYCFALSRKSRALESAQKSEQDKQSGKAVSPPVREEIQNWLAEHAESGPVGITSFDGLKLAGAYVSAPESTHRWVITVHGYRGDRRDMGPPARAFYQMGFHVLAPDLRGHGESEGSYVGMGWHDRLDLLRWVEFVLERDPEAEIVLHGISMGGATVMMAAGEPLPSNVRAIIEDCGYSSVADEFCHEMRSWFKMTPFPLLYLASLITRIRAGYGFWQASAVKQLRKNTTVPMLFVHGEADTFVPFRMQKKCYDAAACEKEFLSVPGAGHAESALVDPERVWGTLYRFLTRYINGVRRYDWREDYPSAGKKC